MCGIVGIVRFDGRPVDAEVVHAMAAQLSHRGPDDHAVWVEGPVGLGHRRLAIIDLSDGGKQPKLSSQADKVLVFNGEIYNYRELRTRLDSLGHRFKTQSDTEVLLASFDEWGKESLKELAGMFAFAVWDRRNRRLFLARDRFGKKPLQVFEFPGGMAFASEFKAFYCLDEFRREIDPSVLRHYFSLRYIPAPMSIWKGCRKLRPAHWMQVSMDGQRSEGCYWTLPLHRETGKAPESAESVHEDLHALLRRAVGQRMISDVPLGVFLSGGVDSSLVAAVMTELSDEPIRTFTIAFPGTHDESRFANQVSGALRTIHRDFPVSADEILNTLPEFVRCYDEPFADQSALPSLVVSRLAREEVKVVLTGDGGDEIFYGYKRYRWMRKLRVFQGLPEPLRLACATLTAQLPGGLARRLAGAMMQRDEIGLYAYFMDSWKHGRVDDLLGTRGVEARGVYARVMADYPGLKGDEFCAVADQALYLPEDLLVKVDRASMWHSLEVRSPLLDHRLAEWAADLPVGFKVDRGVGKALLKSYLRRRFPDWRVYRKKRGFEVPLGEWFRGGLRDLLLGELARLPLRAHGLFNEREVERLVQLHLSCRDDVTTPLWQLLAFQLWYREHVLTAAA